MSVERFRSALAAGDHEAAVLLLAPDVTFHSPIVHRLYEGRDAVAPILAGVVTVFNNFRYTGEYTSADGAGAILTFSCRVGDRDLDGVDILRFGPDGLITDFSVMVRPYSAATELRQQMAALLSAT